MLPADLMFPLSAVLMRPVSAAMMRPVSTGLTLPLSAINLRRPVSMTCMRRTAFVQSSAASRPLKRMRSKSSIAKRVSEGEE